MYGVLALTGIVMLGSAAAREREHRVPDARPMLDTAPLEGMTARYGHDSMAVQDDLDGMAWLDTTLEKKSGSDITRGLIVPNFGQWTDSP